MSMNGRKADKKKIVGVKTISADATRSEAEKLLKWNYFSDFIAVVKLLVFPLPRTTELDRAEIRHLIEVRLIMSVLKREKTWLKKKKKSRH